MADRLLTPQQENFLAYYTDPKSDTFSNAYKSALKAEYSEEYSQNITGQMPDWLSDSISDARRLKKAEKRLDQILDMEPIDESGKPDNSLIANQMKAINLVAKGLGKSKYSERQEHTGTDGQPLLIRFDSAFNEDTPRQTEGTGT
jgi:hypothetical protein